MLTALNLRKQFYPKTIDEVTALNRASLSLQKGEFVTIIGSNGAGKSTLLNALAGAIPLDSGTIEVDGHDVTNLPEYARAKYMGRVFQDPKVSTVGSMEVEENMALAYLRGQNRGLVFGVDNRLRGLFAEALSHIGLGLETRLRTRVSTLSGGQRQALALVMATISRPAVLLLDEHTASLDPKTARLILEITGRIISEEQLTTLMVTHNMHDAIQHGTRLIMMHEGSVVLDIGGAEKLSLTVQDLIHRFEHISGGVLSDRTLLA